MVARLEPEADESVGEPIPSLEEGLPAQDRVTVDDGGMVGLPRGVGGEEVHGHTIVRSGSPAGSRRRGVRSTRVHDLKDE
jgi:hypothetical protein